MVSLAGKRLWAAVVVLIVLGSACSGGDDDVATVEPTELSLGGSVQGMTHVDNMVWLTIYRSPSDAEPEGWTDLIQVDSETGEAIDRWSLGPGRFLDDLVHLNHSFYASRYGALQGIERLPFLHLDERVIAEEQVLVRFDIASERVVSQHQYPVLVESEDVRFDVFDSKIWLFGTVGIGIFNPETGSFDLLGGRLSLPLRDVRAEGRSLWVESYGHTWEVDLDAGELARRYDVSDYLLPPEGSLTFLSYHDGAYWVSGTLWGEDETVYQFDLDTGERSDPMARSELPLRSIEAGGERWDLLDESTAGSDSPQVWQRIDLATGETVRRYEFEGSEPKLVAGGHLWLLKKTADGTRLGRIPLEATD